MIKVAIKCDFCGKELQRYPSKVKDKNFCSKECTDRYASKKYNPDGYKYKDFSKNSARFSAMNRELNPSRMTMETRQKLRTSHLGKGEGKAYPKIYGQHAHRAIAEQILGRPLEPGEVVHHKDGDKLNFSPDNLIIFSSQEEHARHHLEIEKIIHGTVMGREVMPK